MTYFPDLAPYAYARGIRGVVHVGWLDGTHPFPKGSVEGRLIEKMKLLAAKPVQLYRGLHLCELCVEPPRLEKTMMPNRLVIDPNCSWAKWHRARSGNGEIRVLYGRATFAAPVLIAHYIEEHGYLPPARFLKAIDNRLKIKVIISACDILRWSR
jgi:hypothetical protein